MKARMKGGETGQGGAGRREGVEQRTGKDVEVEYEKTVVGLGIYDLPAVAISFVSFIVCVFVCYDLHL